MRTKPALVVAGVCCAALLASVFAANGPEHRAGKVWQVRYHKSHPNKNNDIAMRLYIKRGPGTTLDATLIRYDDIDTKSKKYKPRAKGGQIDMKGNVTKAGGGKQRKRESFKLEGTYPKAGGGTAKVLVQGFHHAGVDRNSDLDDWLCIRVYDDSIVYLGRAGGPCDEEPPDEDNLSEEPDSSQPPDYDGDDP